MIETITISEKRKDVTLNAMYLLKNEGDHIKARGTFVAWGQGVQMMGLVIQKLQEESSKRELPIIHEFIAVNEASLKLIQQFEEYKPDGDDGFGHPLFSAGDRS